jgi:hypothetical protein
VFAGACVNGNAQFHGTDFGTTDWLGPLLVTETLNLDRATFRRSVHIEVAAAAVNCQQTTFAADATLRLRYASIVLDHATSERPVTIAAATRPFTVPRDPRSLDTSDRELDDTLLNRQGTAPGPKLLSLRGVDASRLVLVNIDLTECRFVDVHQLDQLRLDGLNRFAYPPPLTIQGRLLLRRPRRRTLIEEHTWRAVRGRPGWAAPPALDSTEQPLEAERLAAAYRQLRKAQEDAKNEPGAADFYFGEMEMRRYAKSTPASEKLILNLYWAISGYGLRASRAMATLGIVIALTVVLLVSYGLPNTDQRQQMTGTLTAPTAGRNSFTATLDEPEARLTGSLAQRWTRARVDQATRVALGAVVFRDAGQKLTTAGSYTTLGARFFGPVLLALAALALRGRVKR